MLLLARKKNKSKSKSKGIFKFIWKIFWLSSVSFLAASILLVLVFRFVPVPFTPLMFIRTAEQLFSGKSIKMNNRWIPIEEISPSMQLAVICAEDQKFLQHHGFDYDAISKAFHYNETHSKQRGASTISQQTAKNLFLWPGRNWVRKGFEAYFTVLMEFFWSKQRILEVYLNIIETGAGIYGVESAADEYFNTDAEHLSRQQSALIAAILPNPRAWSPVKPNTMIKGRQVWILRQMGYWGSLKFEK